jgi:hypothetical protein
MIIASLLEKSAIRHGDRPALTVHDEVHANYLPTNNYGKVLKTDLRNLLSTLDAEAQHPGAAQ